MLLDMLTADAAAKHGQENSSPRLEPPPARNGSFLVQMPLSVITSYLRRPTPSASPATTTTDNVDPTAHAPDTSAPQSDAMTTAQDEFLVSPVPSRPASSGSSAAGELLKKKHPRSKTSYLIARSAQPVNPRSKLHLRPRVLLQLHQVIASQRPKPAYDIIPFALLPQRSARNLGRTFNTRERLGHNDVLVVEAEAYSSKGEEKRSDDERWASQEVIGVISPWKCEKGLAGKPDICMNDGISRWEVTEMANGGYEFNFTDDHGLTLKARWVLKTAHSRRVSSMSTGPSPAVVPGQEDKKFTFSTISSTSRRHPIIATMTRTGIDVLDSYAMPSVTSPSTPSIPSHTQSPAMTPSSIDLHSFADPASDPLPVKTDDALRRFIIVTGVWVASQTFCSSHSSSQSSTPTLATTLRPPNNRTVSMSFIESSRSPSPASTVEENRRSFPKMIRTARSTSFTEPPASFVSPVNASPVLKTRSRRANTVGTTPLHSMTGSMRNRHGLGLAFEDQALVESEEERQTKRSVELLRIKELALSPPLERPSIETPVIETNPRPIPAPIPSPVVIPPSPDGLAPPTPPSPERARKTQSAYNPIKTAGLWDSGVTEGPGLKKRPTSMFVMSERKRKQDKKSERSKSKENKEGKPKREEEAECLGWKRKSDWYKYKIKLQLKGLFKREKA